MNQNLFTHIHIQLRHNGQVKFHHNVMTRVYVTNESPNYLVRFASRSNSVRLWRYQNKVYKNISP